MNEKQSRSKGISPTPLSLALDFNLFACQPPLPGQRQRGDPPQHTAKQPSRQMAFPNSSQ
jgi:hypothetical protein